MKPRIVREWDKAEDGLKTKLVAYLQLPWPKDCPYTPEQVMAACERKGVVLSSVPTNEMSTDWWWVRVKSQPGHSEFTETLTPEFMAEPKGCEHAPFHCVSSGRYIECPKCGTVIHDRRYGERRKGERRAITAAEPICFGGTIRGDWPGRRTGEDRRQS